MLEDLRKLASGYLISGMKEEFLKDPDNGGESCYNYMTFDYKLTVTFFCVGLN